MPRSARGSAALFALLLSLAPAAFGQQAAIEFTNPLRFPPFPTPSVGYRIDDAGVVVGGYGRSLDPPKPMRWTRSGGVELLEAAKSWTSVSADSAARAMSADGSVIVGHSYYVSPRAFRWTEAEGMRLLEQTIGNVTSFANGVSADGSVIVGGRSLTEYEPPRAFRWTQQGGLVDLGSIDGGAGTSLAEDVSADGSVAVGVSTATVSTSPQRAFRWTEAGGMQSLGTIGGVSGGKSHAWDVSPDGATIVGGSTTPDSRYHGFVWSTATETMEELPTIGNFAGDCEALSISNDGHVIAGWSMSAASPSAGEACVWYDRVPYSLSGLLKQTYGVDMTWWQLKKCRCSPDGTRFTGEGVYQAVAMGFCVSISDHLQPPQIVSDVANGSTQWAEVGLPYKATFVATDPDGGDLKFSVERLPPGVTATPPTGTIGSSPMTVELNWTPQAIDFGRGDAPIVSFTDEFGSVVTRSFGLFGRQNAPPSVEPLLPRRIECVDGAHTVELSTVVADGNGHPLTLTWSVDGQIEQTETNVATGTESRFEFDYDHGSHDVVVRVADGYSGRSAGTVVTVEDTLAPLVFVAADRIVSTDAGEAFASNVTLTPPTISDSSGHDVTLENDAPSTYSLGTTIVTWRATDEGGHVTEAQQRVIVEDREKPSIAGSASMNVFVDPGKIFSTARPPVPAASDNVTDASQLAITHDAPSRFSIGKTVVTFKATDDAGNVAEWPVTVTVVNRRPRAKAGSDVTITANNDRGARAKLDGSASSDLDQQKLKFEWTAAGMTLTGTKSATPSGLFPVGVTVVTLTVTDPAGATSLDRMRVVVKRKNAKPRPHGRAANASFAQAETQAKRSVAAGVGSAHALAALGQATAAARLGDAAGDEIRWDDGIAYDGAALTYVELRALQRAYGAATARSLLAAYAESEDERLLVALGHAMRGTIDAQTDAIDP